METRKKALGQEHPHTLKSMSDLAMTLHYRGKDKRAEEMSRRALEWREKMLGAEHPDTLTSVNCLAMVLRDQGM